MHETVHHRRSVWPLLAALGGVAVAGLLLSGSRLCLSPSAPPGLYVPSGLPLERGAWVQLCLPEPVVSFGRERGYHPSGWPPARCADGSAPALKRLGAVAGDLVEVSERGIAVNGAPLPNTRPLPVDSAGRPLPWLVGLRLRIPEGQCWVYSDSIPNSWDSRYYGPLPATAIVARMRPLVTL
jgi:conjugative transfer signal peptidase TraF